MSCSNSELSRTFLSKSPWPFQKFQQEQGMRLWISVCWKGVRLSLKRVKTNVQKLKEIAEGIVGSEIPLDMPLMEAGLDSISLVELRNSVSASFGVELPATVTFDYPSLQALAGYIGSRAQMKERRVEQIGFRESRHRDLEGETERISSQLRQVVEGKTSIKLFQSHWPFFGRLWE